MSTTSVVSIRKMPAQKNQKSYGDLAREAIIALKDRTGSSMQAIKNHIVANNSGLNFQQVSAMLLRLLGNYLITGAFQNSNPAPAARCSQAWCGDRQVHQGEGILQGEQGGRSQEEGCSQE
ncbi:hypothetical protein EON64_09800, partial [archaeon]